MTASPNQNFKTERLRPSIHPTYARLLCAQLRQLGFDDDDIFAGTHLEWQQLLGDNRFLSFEQIRRIIVRALDITQRPWIGLSVGSITQASAHGPLGYGAVAAENVGQALELVARLSGLRQKIFDINVLSEKQRCQLIIVERFDFGDVRYYLLDMILGTIVKVAETVSGIALNDASLLLPFDEPPWADHYQRVFHNQRIDFGAPCMMVDFPLSYLELPSLTADPNAYRAAKQECERLLKLEESGGEFAQRIRNHFLDHGPPYPSLDVLAGHLNVSKRTLIRKLKGQGTSYRELLDDVRKELAAWHLLNTNNPIDNIAEQLGYLDTTNFSRTFRRWYRTTPRDFRTQV